MQWSGMYANVLLVYSNTTKERTTCNQTDVFDRYSRQILLRGGCLWSKVNLYILQNHLHCLDWEVSCCEAQHLGFEPMTSHLSALTEAPAASRSAGGSAWTDKPKTLHFLFRLQPTLPKLEKKNATCVSGNIINITMVWPLWGQVMFSLQTHKPVS